MAGDTTGYSSASDADGALSFLLVFWTGGDPEQIERIMRLSRLGEGREQKWERHDYLSKLTIPSAINKHVSKGGDFYSPNGHGHCHGNNPNGYSSNGQGPDGKTKTDTPKVEGSAADRLVAYTLAEDVELFCDQSGAPHLLDGTEPTPLTSRVYKYLRRLMWKHEGKVVARDALQGAAGTLAAFASDSGRVRELHTRAAFVDDTLYYELGPGRYAVVSANGWHVAESVPVLFRRIPNLLELPEPERGGSLSDGEFMVNLKGDRDKRLFRAYTVLAPLPHISRPILLTTGAMGSGKTTANRYVKKLLDPTKPEMVRMDKRGEFLQKASHCFLVMLDNETRMPEWAADTICRLTTGEADSKRVLYSDDDDFIYDMMRALLINGINVPTDRTDFLDRSLTVELERVRKRDRVPESKLWEHFSTIRPKLLGAIFEGLSAALKELPDTHPDELPRLADWGRYATAYYKACGHSEQTFAADWSEVERAQNLAAYDGSPLAQVIIAFMHDRTEWKGNATTLYKELTRVADAKHLEVDRDPAWPRTGRTLWRGIRELVSVLDAADISAQRGRTREGSTIRLLKRCDDNVTING